MQGIVEAIVGVIDQLGYPGIVAAMFLESSFFPFPSEVVIPPAGYLASQGRMALWAVVLLGTLGSVLGALFNYWVSLKLGRPLLFKLGRYVGLTPVRFGRAEAFFRRHGEMSTLVGRLIPGLRQYISLPAGLARMDLKRFTLFTALGAGVWVSVLALLGYWIGANRELLGHYLHRATIALIAAATVLVAAYAFWHLVHRSKAG